jgi:5'-nucleotidase
MDARPVSSRRRRIAAGGLAAAAAAWTLAGCTAASRPPVPAAGAAPATLRIVAFNDFHGQLEPGGLTLRLRDPQDPARTLAVGAGGAAHLATLVRRLRDEVPHAVVVSAGDLVGASPLASALFLDEPTIEAMNALGLDLGAVGNHEFDRGVAELRRLHGGGCVVGDPQPGTVSCAGPAGRHAGARFALLAANVTDDAGRPLLPASVVREVDGLRVAFVGAVLRGTPTVVAPSGVSGLRFGDEADAINREVARLKAAERIEAFVAIVHEGGTTDGDWNDPACPGARGPIFAIADRLAPEVDLVLSGHSHQGYACVRDAPGNPGLRVTQAVANGRAVTVVDLALERGRGDVDRARTRMRNLPVANGLAGDRAADARFAPLPPDPAVQAIVAHYAERARPLAERPVGRIAATVDRAPSAGGDSALGRLVADAHLAATRAPGRGGARLALTNPGGLRADLRCAGPGPCPVRFGEVFAAQPFGNSLVTMTLTGAQLLAALEQQFSGVNAQRPRVLQPSAGFTFAWRAAPGPGPRIVEARLDGAPIDPGARYRVAVNSFLAEGGDGFDAFAQGTERLGGVQDLDALLAWLGAADALEPPRQARVRRVAD